MKPITFFASTLILLLSSCDKKNTSHEAQHTLATDVPERAVNSVKHQRPIDVANITLYQANKSQIEECIRKLRDKTEVDKTLEFMFGSIHSDLQDVEANKRHVFYKTIVSLALKSGDARLREDAFQMVEAISVLDESPTCKPRQFLSSALTFADIDGVNSRKDELWLSEVPLRVWW